MNPPRKLRACLFLAIVGLAHACAQTPLPALPAADVPEVWSSAAAQSTDNWPDSTWWREFDSAELSGLMEQVEERNLDLATNQRQLRQAELALREAGFALYPTPVIELGASSAYNGIRPRGGDYSDNDVNSIDLSAGIVYSDILGKPAQYDTARAIYDSRIALATDTRLNTLALAASTYFQILLVRDRIDAARQNLDNAEAIASIVQARYEAGTVTQIDALQQRNAVQQQRSDLRTLAQNEFAARSALALLLAEGVQTFDVHASSLQNIEVPTVQPGLPAQLLVRRPDIVQAEANLRVSRANVDLVRTAFLPNISLTGTLSLASTSLSELLDGGDTLVAATASVLQTLLDNGARRRALESARLDLESSLADYRKTAIAAFNSVDVALSNIALLQSLDMVAQETLQIAEEAYRIAGIRYREGVADYQTVLLTQNSLFDARNAYLDNKLSHLNAIVALYQALGGGWEKGQAR